MIKVLSSVKISGIKGSAVKRAELAKFKTEQVFNEIDDIFAKNGEIEREEITRIIQKHAPGVRFKVIKALKGYSEGWMMGYPNHPGAIKKLEIALPFVKKDGKRLLSEENAEPLFHEIRHFFDYVTNPKFICKNNWDIAFKDDSAYKNRSQIYENFFSNILYPNEVPPQDALTKLFASDSKRKIGLKMALESIFINTPSEEKIAVLQQFRHVLQSEKNAFTDGIILSDKLNLNSQIRNLNHGKGIGNNPSKKQLDGIETFKQVEYKKSEAKAEVFVNKNLFYKSKIELLNEMLLNEITASRKDHWLTLEKTYTPPK